MVRIKILLLQFIETKLKMKAVSNRGFQRTAESNCIFLKIHYSPKVLIKEINGIQL